MRPTILLAIAPFGTPWKMPQVPVLHLSAGSADFLKSLLPTATIRLSAPSPDYKLTVASLAKWESKIESPRYG